MSWIWATLTALVILDGIRLRARARSLPVLAPSTLPVSSAHTFFIAPGVVLDEATLRAASAHASAHGLDVLDLVPPDTKTADALGLLQLLDPRTYRGDRMAVGRTAGAAILATLDVVERARVEGAPADPVSFIRLATRLKRFASLKTDVAVAPGLRAIAPDPEKSFATMRALLANALVYALVVPPILWALMVYAGVTSRVGLLLLVAYHLQPLLVFAGSPLVPGDLWTFFARLPLDVYRWARGLLGRWRPPARGPDPLVAKRLDYARRLEGGVGRFFEPRRSDCPLCGGRDLSRYLLARDWMQHKPGRFTLERCGACAHVFQNPRLSIEGLSFYYSDFYDGVGEEAVDLVFAQGYGATPYLTRARLLEGFARPERWLDVGCGHAHFCSFAREVWPDARFEGLDLNEDLEEAVRRGWLDAGHRGLFPDVAPRLTRSYDVVSMTHYLEHTRDPRAEIAAAARVLRPGGHYFVEIPDPECPWARFFGAMWIPWLQPQHLHFLSVKNLDRLLREEGFEPVLWQRGQAHMTVEFLFVVVITLSRLAPTPNAPWRAKDGFWAWLRWRVVWTLGIGPMLVAHLLDRLLALVARRLDVSNTFRVLARKRAEGAIAVVHDAAAE